MVNLDKAKALNDWYLVLKRMGSIYGFNLHDDLKEVYNEIKSPAMPQFINSCGDCLASYLYHVNKWYSNLKLDEPILDIETTDNEVVNNVAQSKKGRKPKNN